ncbi:MAG: glycosyltransferase family 4 protein [Bacteroidia bacterium]|nr:glycosyltransferase family 4 protein [Bacteroidia bacterium]
MHIGFITSEYPHPKVKHAAGIATSIKNLAVTLAKKGEKVVVFVYHQDLNEVVIDQGVEIHLIKAKSYSLFGWYLSRKHIQNYVNSIVNKEGIQLLEAPDWTGITAFMKFKVPLVIRFHGSDAYFCMLEGRKQKLKNSWYERIALKNAAAYIAPTTFAGEETSKIFNLEKKKVKTIHYGLEMKKFINDHPHKFNENTILYIGTIIRKKGVFELAQIFNKIIENNPQARLIMIGSDSPDLKSGSSSTYHLIKEIFSDNAKNQVEYLGQVPYSQVMEHIKNAHVCTFPSFAETLGMVTIESMALQKPVVNTSIGWAKELIDDGVNGYLVNPMEIDIYTKRILALLNDKNLCDRIGKAARLKIESTFDIDKIADMNINYYKSIIG